MDATYTMAQTPVQGQPSLHTTQQSRNRGSNISPVTRPRCSTMDKCRLTHSNKLSNSTACQNNSQSMLLNLC